MSLKCTSCPDKSLRRIRKGFSFYLLCTDCRKTFQLEPWDKFTTAYRKRVFTFFSVAIVLNIICVQFKIFEKTTSYLPLGFAFLYFLVISHYENKLLTSSDYELTETS